MLAVARGRDNARIAADLRITVDTVPTPVAQLACVPASLLGLRGTAGNVVALASKNAALITMLRETGPLGGAILGLVLILAALIPFRRRGRPAVRAS